MRDTLFERLSRYWKLDEPAGALRVDSTGLGSGFREVVGATTNDPDGGLDGGCLVGSGNGAVYLNLQDSDFTLESPSTLSIWIKYDAAPALLETIFYSLAPYDVLLKMTPAGNVQLEVNGSGLIDLPITFGAWNLVVLVRDNGRWSMSVDAGAQTSYISAELLAPSTVRIAGSGYDAFSGSMCEVGFWKKALTQDQIRRLWNGGAGLFPTEFETGVDRRISKKTAAIVIAVDFEFGILFKNWISDSTYNSNGVMKSPCDWEITQVRWNNDVLVRADNPLQAENTPGSWHWDGTHLWVCPPSDPSTGASRIALGKWFWWSQPRHQSVFSTAVIALGIDRVANLPRILGDHYYESRLLSAPNLSLRIPAKFGDLNQSGSGSMKLANADGYYNSIDRFALAAGTVTIRMGVDVPGSEMDVSEYEVVSVWGIESWTRSDSDLVLGLRERKNKNMTKLPFDFYTRAEFPNIDQSFVGKPVAIGYGTIYGAPAVPIDVGLRKFKLTRRVKDLLAVKLKVTNDQLNSRDIAGTSWLFYSGTTYRYYQPAEETTNVTFNGQSLTKVNSVEDCASTRGSWCFAENFTYVNTKVGFTILSGTYSIQSRLQVVSWVQTNFASKNVAAGEFTLGPDWGSGMEVSVDFIGEPEITNAIDVIRDLFIRSGHTQLNEESFDIARQSIRAGTDESGDDVYLFPVGVFIDEQKEVGDIITQVQRAVRSFVYTNPLGQISIVVFEPKPGEGLVEIPFSDSLTFMLDVKAVESTAIKVAYNKRRTEDWAETAYGESIELQNTNSQTEPVVFDDKDNPLTSADAIDAFIQRFLTLDALQLRTYRLTAPWNYLRLKPGDQVMLSLQQIGTALIAECLEVNIDLASKRVALVVGEQRGLYDTAGFWVDDDAKLPDKFSSLAGYGSGSLDWNDNWDPEIKLWAKQNVGYWCDENGFASSTDPDSQLTSNWI